MKRRTRPEVVMDFGVVSDKNPLPEWVEERGSLQAAQLCFEARVVLEGGARNATDSW